MFSKQEYQNRIAAISKEMAKQGLDALIVIDSEHIHNGGNVRYLTNYVSSSGIPQPPSAAIILPPDVILCIHPGFFKSSMPVAELDSPYIKEVVGSGQGLWGPTLGKDIKGVLNASKRSIKKIGIDGLPNVFGMLANAIRKDLGDFSIAEDTGIVEKARMVKSAEECDFLRQVAVITDNGIKAWIESIKAGQTQHSSVITGEQAAKLIGAEDAALFMGAGNPWIYGKYRGSLVYTEGDMACADFNPKVMGYYGQVSRTCVIGKSQKKQKDIFEVALEAYQSMVSRLKPGVRASNIYETGQKVILKAGFSVPQFNSGYGLGLSLGEGFTIKSSDKTEMKSGFYLTIRAMVAHPEDGICASIGNSLLITENGYEELNKAPYRVQI